ncbi:hypothetical protein [Nocardia tengchongensis]|uniref:hypothetical protein n=1 Tax=Nocardia tengchongensis TaxID=2055889 RepID=UPI0036BB6C49
MNPTSVAPTALLGGDQTRGGQGERVATGDVLDRLDGRVVTVDFADLEHRLSTSRRQAKVNWPC